MATLYFATLMSIRTSAFSRAMLIAPAPTPEDARPRQQIFATRQLRAIMRRKQACAPARAGCAALEPRGAMLMRRYAIGATRYACCRDASAIFDARHIDAPLSALMTPSLI